MKILHVLGKMNYGGIESVVFSYLKLIDTEKYSIDVAYGSKSLVEPPQELEKRGIRFIKVPSYTNVPGFIRAIKTLVAENKYDIIHAHMNSLSFLPLYAAKKGGASIRICHNHTASDVKEGIRGWIKWILRFPTLKYATEYAACSDKAAVWMYGDELFRSGTVKVFNNGIDTNRFLFNQDARAFLREKYNLEGCFVICHIGRFCLQKNHLFLARVIKNLVDSGTENVKFILIGDGDSKKDVEEYIKSSGLCDKVIFTGNITNACDYYSASDMFILPSLYEGLPVVAVEAQANGLECLMSDNITKDADITGRAEYITISDGTGPWVEKIKNKIKENSAADISSKINTRITDNRTVAESDYNIIKAVKSLEAYYDLLTENRTQK